MTDTTALDQLRSYLEQDPENVPLRLDCARAALDANDTEEAKSLLQGLSEDGMQSAGARSVGGLIALREADYATADTTFASLLEDEPDDASLQFNRAWALGHLGRHDEALETLSENAALAIPQAAMLRLQLLHQAGEFEDAGEAAKRYVDAFPNYEGLLAAASTLAMDNDDPDWARELASRAPSHPEAQTTLATLMLSDGDASEAQAQFDAILQTRPNSARAWIGKGLSQIMTSDSEAASQSLDKGAEIFGTHLGSWIAAGWSYVTRGDLDTARQRFETALALDDTFSESHGALGVIDIIENKPEDGREKIRTARRLDKDCFSAALGQMLLLQGQGREDAAKDIFERAMNTPIDESGQTLSSAMMKMGLN